SPRSSTLATFALLVDQITARPVREFPLPSSGVAVSCTVCPTRAVAAGGSRRPGPPAAWSRCSATRVSRTIARRTRPPWWRRRVRRSVAAACAPTSYDRPPALHGVKGSLVVSTRDSCGRNDDIRDRLVRLTDGDRSRHPGASEQ